MAPAPGVADELGAAVVDGDVTGEVVGVVGVVDVADEDREPVAAREDAVDDCGDDGSGLGALLPVLVLGATGGA